MSDDHGVEPEWQMTDREREIRVQKMQDEMRGIGGPACYDIGFLLNELTRLRNMMRPKP